MTSAWAGGSRAIVYLAWGADFVDRAIASAMSAGFLALPRILLTDAAQAERGRASGAFEIVRAFDPGNWDHLCKCRIIDFLPQGFDTFLYLDADTVVLGDPGFGFEKAERHGVAVSPAPKYNLAHYGKFDDVLRAADARVAPQLVYNSGVIFFNLSQPVRDLFRHWERLAESMGRPLGYLRDQPFFALAAEQRGFNPYVLPPVYNYRGYGEVAAGDVLIWHSHRPPPQDLNLYSERDSRRRYLDGARVPFRQ